MENLNVIDNNNTMSDDEVVASYIPPRILAFPLICYQVKLSCRWGDLSVILRNSLLFCIFDIHLEIINARCSDHVVFFQSHPGFSGHGISI